MDSKNIGGIDLHIHSTASDGTFAPEDLLNMAVALGLQAFAITDHDTLDGARAVRVSAIPETIHFISGVEISTQAPPGFDAGGSLHILGYGIDVDNPALLSALSELQHARDQRMPRIVRQLNEAGVPICLEHVLAEVGQGAAGRPHIANTLIKMGIVADVDEAFDRFLTKGRPGYVDKYKIPCRQAITLIREAGGAPVLAHPYLIRTTANGGLEELTPLLRDMGLMGIEAYYPKHPPEVVDRILSLAGRYNLLVTGGTDFHGDLTPGIEMGRGQGDLFVPYALYEALITAVSG